MALVYIHIGKTLIDYLIDSVYQTLHTNDITIYILLSDILIDEFNQQLSMLNHEKKNNVKIIALSLIEPSLSMCEDYVGYIDIVKHLSTFRDSFWISTTCRFFYVKEFVKLYLKDSKNIFHIENDIMLYKPLNELSEIKYVNNHVYMVKDSPNRVIPSIMCFCDLESLESINRHIFNTLKSSNKFLNDMDILAKYPYLIKLRHDPYKENEVNYVYDGAAIGQYLGGVDYRNIPNSDNILTQLNNPTVGFMNETCDFKMSGKVNKKYIDGLKIYMINQLDIVNLHIHSKQLFKFSSVFDIDYKDIITGDRVFNLVDYVVTTHQIYSFHNLKNSDINPVKMILLENVKNILKNGSVKLFVYTHILDYFIEHLIDTKYDQHVTIYTHNSDHEFTEGHYNKLSSIFKNLTVFAQNVNCELHDNVHLLPIGLANSMWKHGSIVTLYQTMKETYRNKKTKGIYININPKTYPYRYEILKRIDSKYLSRTCDFPEYLKKLSEFKYCLCVRGNGIDTHRFWECLYLGVIPVIINDRNTNCKNYVNYLKKLNIPFEEINEITIDLTKYDDSNYKATQCLKQLKLSSYA